MGLLPLLLAALVTGWVWAPLLGLTFTGEDYVLLGRVRRGLDVSPHVYRPLLGAWMRAFHALFGAGSAVPFHAGSLALHLANVALVFLLARRLFRGPWLAGAVAVVFGVGAAACDSLAWIAATNRPLSGFGALLALNGLARFEERAAWPVLLCLGGLAWQFGSNEEFYGTALLAIAWLGWVAWSVPARRSVALGVVVFAAALLGLHYGVIHRVPGGTEAVLQGTSQLATSVAARAGAVARGLGLPGVLGLVGVPVGTALAWLLGERRAASFCFLAWGASFVPFALSDAVGYRFYPTLAPTALCLVPALLLVACRVARVPYPLGALALVVFALVGSHGPRVARLMRWRDALREVAACREPLRELAASHPDTPPLSVNLELTTMGLVYYLWPGLERETAVPYRAFLDAVGGYVPLDEAPGTLGDLWFGRRCEGSYGIIEPARYFAGRPEVEKVRLYARARPAGSLEGARAELARPDLDLRREAVVEAALPAALSGGPADEAPGSLTVVEPFHEVVPNVEARMRVRVRAERQVVLAYQDHWLYDPLFRLPPDQTIFSGVERRRGFRLVAEAGGRRLPTFHVNAFGLGALVPAGEHEIALTFRRLTPEELRR